MKWFKLRIKTTTEAEDILISTLYDYGLEGAQIEDHIPLTPLEKEQMFVDIMPETEADDGVAYLTFYVEEKEDGSLELNGEKKSPEQITNEVKDQIDEISDWGIDLGEASITTGETEDIDWINNWKKYFHQFTIDDLLVIPSWEEAAPEDADKKILHIDPGTAFGTGMHETTQLCIRQMKQYLKEDTVLLDVGTGSGILGILALMYGAKHVKATDLDPCAVPAVADNIAQNDVDEKAFELMIGNIITEDSVKDWAGYECYDIVMSNILADVLVPLAPAAVSALKPGGVWITSGIIEGKEELVADTMRKMGLEVTAITKQGEWRNVTGKKPC